MYKQQQRPVDTIQVFYDQVFFDQVFLPTLTVSTVKKTWTELGRNRTPSYFPSNLDGNQPIRRKTHQLASNLDQLGQVFLWNLDSVNPP